MRQNFPDIAENDLRSIKVDPDGEFFDIATVIDTTRWNKSFPYQLATLVADDGGNYSIEDVFTLPIGPEEMSIMTPFAIQTSAVLDGIVEQHNGAPFRMIQFSGTTGVLPSRSSQQGLRSGVLAEVGAIFGGTIQAAKTAFDQGKAVFTGQTRGTTNLYDENDEDIKQRTGYYQFRALQRFLEHYVAYKKTENGKKLRLGLLIWKDQAAYLVSPQQFEVRRSAMSPFEYRYSLVFKAWRRIDPSSLGQVGPVLWGASQARRTPVFNNILNRIGSGRRALKAGQATLKAVYSDFDANVMGPIREVSLGIKDAIGLARTAIDFPSSFAEHMRAEWRAQWDIVKNLTDPTDPDIKALNAQVASTGKLDGPLPDSFLEVVPVSSPTAEAQTIIDEAMDRARSYGREDFDRLRNETLARAADFADRVGIGNSTWNQILGRTTTPKMRDATDEDYRILDGLSEIAESYARLASFEEEPPALSNLEYVAGLAALAGINFRIPRSKFAVPFPYGSTLEQMAAHYLGDATRWQEIATLNSLTSPYVDEEGFEVALIANGKENTIAVASVDHLYQGQTVSLYANLVTPFKRRILAIERVQDDFWFLTLDGAADLDRLTMAGAATLHAFYPNTVNSQQLIYIPSEKEAEQEPNVPSVPGVSDLDAMLSQGGIDLLLTPKGDLVVTPEGDCRVAAGLTNIIQRVRVAFATPRGALLLHPEFGLEVAPGTSNADFNAEDLLASAKGMFKGDPAIASINAATVEKLGPVTRLGIEVSVVGSDVPLPIGIDVR